RFDYSLDTNNFFDTQQKRDVLQAAADRVVARFGDTLAGITAADGNSFITTFTHPSGGDPVRLENPVIRPDELLIYVGAQELGNTTSGIATGVGLFAEGSREFLDLVFSRGEPGALGEPETDYGPIGGSITFDLTNDWYFGIGHASL